ncbi:rho GTPase-activating protein gacV-like isoform X4 [Nerophis ophidion]|uniref:rho GTPase-activating protein gacV-like isoform X4 n=1 Tax=Nerophis ophidion TaxID=159077 RepID=UPI002ADFDF21|nr:rho GTPase-activating protein gacV-like isoform X4 [Nerophis ophidion]
MEHQEECLPHLQGDSFTLEYPQPSHFKGDKEVPQPPYFKEEEEGECPVGQEEADVSKFPLTVVSVKTEEHEDKPPESSQLHHSPNDQQPPHTKEEEEDPQTPHIKEVEEDPQSPHMKEEEEEVWMSQEGECPVGQEEADVSKFPLTVVSVKTEEHEDKPPESSQLHHSPISRSAVKLEEVVNNKSLLKDIAMLSSKHQTSKVEAFHSLIIQANLMSFHLSHPCSQPHTCFH